mmetsp:Transcript_13181/g.33448  ORF Transcript_13181/g.33448 Transcript_13181/m.33448 type:complete len:204 (+) Transcript_13181:878-1489(+)
MQSLSAAQKLVSPDDDPFACTRSFLNSVFKSALASSFKTFFIAPFGIVTEVGTWIQSGSPKASSRLRFMDLLPTSSEVYTDGRIAHEATSCFSGMTDMDGTRVICAEKSNFDPTFPTVLKLPLPKPPSGGVIRFFDLTRFTTPCKALNDRLLPNVCFTTSIKKFSPSSFALHVLPFIALSLAISSESKHAMSPWCSFLARTAT